MLSQSHSPNIWIVEDDPEDKMLLEAEIKNTPLFDSTLFIDSIENLPDLLDPPHKPGKQIHFHLPDLILFNGFLYMYRIQGVQNILSRRKELKKIPIGLMVDSQFEAQYFQLGTRPDIAGWMVKPVTAEKLIDLLNRLGKGIAIALCFYFPWQFIGNYLTQI